MSTVSTALLSFGMSGRVFHAPFIHLHPGFELKGAWERSQKNIEKYYPGVKSYQSLEEILEDKSIDLIIVNTPTYTHYEYARRALEAGKHIVVEKAFTTSVAEGKALIALAQKVNKKIAVYQNRRWDSDFLTVQQIIQQGLLGKINEAEIHFDRFNLLIGPKLHKEQPGPGAGILKDLGPHIIDQALHLLGKPTALFADIRTTRDNSAVDDWFDIILMYPDFRVRLKAGYIVREPLPSYIFHGTKGSLIKSRGDIQEAELQKGIIPSGEDWGKEAVNNEGIIHYEKEGEFIKEQVVTAKGNYMKFYETVYHAITQNLPMPVTAEEGTAVIQIIEAAIQSNEMQSVIEL